MSTTYAGADAFPTPITIPDDGDPAAMAILGAALEDLADRTVWNRAQRRRTVLIPLASIPIETSDDFTIIGSGGFVTGTAVGGVAKFPLALDNGATLTGISLRFIAQNGRGSLPATFPKLQLLESDLTVGAGAPSPSTVTTNEYAPANLAEYNNGNIKTFTSLCGLTVDAVNKVYHAVVIDEEGVNSIVGNKYFAIALTYA
jgi:hypothetical protein